jgi:hypothetical protein
MRVNITGYFVRNSVISNHFETQSLRLDISITKQHGDITQKLVIFVSNAGNIASFK